MGATLHGLGVGIAILLLAWTSVLFVPFRWRPAGIYLFVPKVAAGAFAPFIAAAGLLLAGLGLLRGSWWMGVPAGLAALGAIVVIARLGLVRPDPTASQGPGWAARTPPSAGPGWSGDGGAGPSPASPNRASARTSSSPRSRAPPGTSSATCGSRWPACPPRT